MASRALIACGCFVLAMLLSAGLTWLVRGWARRVKMGQTVRSDGPESHLVKMGTPTLGGVGIMGAVTLVGLLPVTYTRRWQSFVLIAGLALLYAAIGFADDYTKLRYKRPLGLKARTRIVLEILLAAAFAHALVRLHVVTPSGAPAQIIPLGSGVLYYVFAIFVIVGSANAVNLTDGLDGLAGGVSCLCALALGLCCFMTGHLELTVICAIVAGACAGFLWFNAHPASIFMGDVGSLFLGALLGAIAVTAKLEIIYGLIGIIFVIEALSVIIQVGYFKLTHGKRVFRMAPFHHHLELGGWAETKVVTRFWLITSVTGAVGLALVAALAH